MEQPIYKAINFDLDTKKMRQYGKYPIGYTEVKRSFLQLGFEHRQWSGYVSKAKMKEADIVFVVERLVEIHPWLSDCTNKFDVTNIGEQFDLTHIIKNGGKVMPKKKRKDNGKGDKPDDGADGGVAPKSPKGPQNGPIGSSGNARSLKSEDTKGNKSGDAAATLADKYRMTQDYQDSVAKYGKKATERVLSQTSKNMTTQGKAKSNKAKAPKSNSNSSGK